MAYTNTFNLNVDIKSKFTSIVPTFKKGDNAILIFRVFDKGVEYSTSGFSRAEITFKLPSGSYVQDNASLVDGRVIYNFSAKTSVETGIIQALLTIYNVDGTMVSVQPFPCYIYSDLKSNGSYSELLADLQNLLGQYGYKFKDAIFNSEKAKPNGVATLDNKGKIPLEQIPFDLNNLDLNEIATHVDKTVFKDKVHGLEIDADGLIKYLDVDGTWKFVGFAADIEIPKLVWNNFNS